MNRKHFITLGGMVTMGTIVELKNMAGILPVNDTRMPVLFVGHGSPMNGIEDNAFSQRWKKLGETIPTPVAVLCVSAHWLTRGTLVTAMPQPRTIHDFGGFPKALFEVEYPAPGSALMAADTKNTVTKTVVGLDHEWGLDHGCWTIVRRMYPKANIPVLQLSIDYSKPMQYHYDLAKELAALRQKGVLIIGSGNMIHNLGMVAWDKINEPEYGYDWAIEANSVFKKIILENNTGQLTDYEKLGKAVQLSIPTPDHYIPLLYAMALRTSNDAVSFFNDVCVGGSLSMTSVYIG